MEKKKIELVRTKNRTFKFGKDIVEYKPYISTEDAVTICTVCLNRFEDLGADVYDLFPAIRNTFCLCVLDKNTNIDIEKIGDPTIIMETSLMEELNKRISNYGVVYGDIVKAIELKNVNKTLVEAFKTIPTEEQMQQNIKETSALISQLNKDDPQTLRKMVETGAIIAGIDESKKEFANKLAEERTKKVQEKKKSSKK